MEINLPKVIKTGFQTLTGSKTHWVRKTDFQRHLGSKMLKEIN